MIPRVCWVLGGQEATAERVLTAPVSFLEILLNLSSNLELVELEVAAPDRRTCALSASSIARLRFSICLYMILNKIQICLG